MLAVVDTSVIIAAVIDGAQAQLECAQAIKDSNGAAAGHAWFESVSVLTRLPPDLRLSITDAHLAVERSVAGTRLLSTQEQNKFRKWLATSEVTGGSIYDALVGWVALVADVPLITRDQRALPTYRRLGIEILLIAPTLAD